MLTARWSTMRSLFHSWSGNANALARVWPEPRSSSTWYAIWTAFVMTIVLKSLTFFQMRVTFLYYQIGLAFLYDWCKNCCWKWLQIGLLRKFEFQALDPGNPPGLDFSSGVTSVPNQFKTKIIPIYKSWWKNHPNLFSHQMFQCFSQT